MLNSLEKMPRGIKRAILIGTDMLFLPLVLWFSLYLRINEWFPPDFEQDLWVFALAPAVAIPLFLKLGLYRAVVRYMGGKAMTAVLQGVSLAVALMYAIVLLANQANVLPRSVWIIYWATALLYIGGSRFLIRQVINNHSSQRDKNRKVVAIYGAGASGAQLATGLIAARECWPVVFIDDKKELQGSIIHDLRVYPRSALPQLIEKKHITHVLLAMPSASKARRREIINELESYSVHVKTIPGLADLVSGKSTVDEIRDVDIEDLLGRDPIPPNRSLLTKCIHGKVVLVTGAGGSIGSELCRQILSQQPTKLVLYEMSEYALYQMEQELIGLKTQNALLHDVEIISILGSVTDKNRLHNVVANTGVQTIYHAAAYKHVPLVEHNPIEGVRNNVFGTLRVTEVARDLQVETFVLISTDKAVRPTSVMGASKRLAELITQAMSRLQSSTRFCMVRFGNVLGSSGSVVPLFRKQIRDGGPITVTHPQISRYFMTIPEASQLVLQAGAMANGGDVFVLDMADPVRIVDLASRMIRLSGLEVKDKDNPHGDITIEFSGLRPGEKLYEELLIENRVSDTDHPRITRARESEMPWTELVQKLGELNQAMHDFDCTAVRTILQSCVAGYTPHAGLSDPAHYGSNVPEKGTSQAKENEAIA